jgi:hypothetical protein
VEQIEERQEFVGALRYLLERVPLACDVAGFLARWRWVAESSLGCIGILRDWLLETVATTLEEGGTSLTVEALARHALHPAKRLQLETEIRAGERQVEGSNASSLQALQALLNTPATTPGSRPASPVAAILPSGTTSQALQGRSAAPVGISKAAAHPGQRAPQRDPVGDSTPDEQPTRCAFVGQVDLAPERLAETGVAKVECPGCGALRTLHPQGSALLFPSHPKRLTRPLSKEVRWIRRGGTWELSAPVPKEQQHV